MGSWPQVWATGRWAQSVAPASDPPQMVPSAESGMSVCGLGCDWSPESVDGHDVEAVFVGVRARACGEDGPGDEARSEGVAELGQATEVGAGCPFVQA